MYRIIFIQLSLIPLFFLSACREKKAEALENLFNVEAISSQSFFTQEELTLIGKTNPIRTVNLKAETSGKIISLPATKGTLLEKNTCIALLDQRDKIIVLKKTQALLDQKIMEHDASLKLFEKGYESNNRYIGAQLALQDAQTQHKKAELDIEYTYIKAPFKGFLNTRIVEEGDFVEIGSSIGTLVENDPMLATGYVVDTQVNWIELGMPAYITIDNHKADGHVCYIAKDSAPSTRTYKVEVQFDNPNFSIPAGANATIVIPYQETKAHTTSHSALCLDDEGNIGVKSVNAEGVVAFNKIEIIKSNESTIWIKGLPDTITLITQGQGFVKEGQHVTVTLK